jgi:hypothetical protein
MTTIYRAQRTSGAAMRARRIARSISVIPSVAEGRADAAPPADGGLHRILGEALASAGEATARAERGLRVAEAERARAARALEHGMHPVTLDETERARLRAAYAAADAVVADARRAAERSRTLGKAVQTIADAFSRLDAEDHELASRLTSTLALWQLASAREQQGSGTRRGSRLRRL